MLNTVGWTNHRTRSSSCTHLVHPDDATRTLCGRLIPDRGDVDVECWAGVECSRCVNQWSSLRAALHVDDRGNSGNGIYVESTPTSKSRETSSKKTLPSGQEVDVETSTRPRNPSRNNGGFEVQQSVVDLLFEFLEENESLVRLVLGSYGEAESRGERRRSSNRSLATRQPTSTED